MTGHLPNENLNTAIFPRTGEPSKFMNRGTAVCSHMSPGIFSCLLLSVFSHGSPGQTFSSLLFCWAHEAPRAPPRESLPENKLASLEALQTAPSQFFQICDKTNGFLSLAARSSDHTTRRWGNARGWFNKLLSRSRLPLPRQLQRALFTDRQAETQRRVLPPGFGGRVGAGLQALTCVSCGSPCSPGHGGEVRRRCPGSTVSHLDR